MKKTIVALSLLITACGGGSSASANPTVLNQSDPFHGISVPSEPNPIGNVTLLGVDSNNNGVRDDVDRQIAVCSNSIKYFYINGVSPGADRDRGIVSLQIQSILVSKGDRHVFRN